RVRVQTAAVNLDAQDLFQAHIAQVDIAAEVVEQCKLAGLVRRLEHHGTQTEGVGEPVRVAVIETAGVVEQAHSPRAFSGLDHQLDSPRIQPAPALVDQLADHVSGKRARVFLAQLELNLQAAP